MKIRRTTLASLALLSFLSLPAAARDIYADVPDDHWAHQALETLAEQHGLKLGYPDGSFRGERTLTRYEMAALVLRLIERMPQQAQGSSALMEALKQDFAKELEALKAANNDDLQDIYDRLDLIETTSMEQRQDLLNILGLNLPFRLSGSAAFRYEHTATEISDLSKTVSSTPQTRVVLSLDSQRGELPFAYGARLSVGNLRNAPNPWWRVGDFFARVEMGLDRFFVSWLPTDNLEFTIGKFANLYSNSELFMDFDVQPEGAFQRLHFEDITPWWTQASLTLGETIINMNSLYQENIFMLSAKGDTRFSFGDAVHLDLGAAYHQYVGEAALYTANQIASENGQAPRVVGNEQRNTNGTQFGVLNGFSALTWNITPTLPLRLSGDYLRNLMADDLNQGLQAGLSLGETRRPGDWQLAYFFKYLESDASVSYFVEDQLRGTDIMAHEGQALLKVWDQTTLFATYQYSSRLSTADSPLHTLRAGVFQAF